jgi:PIN domain nuclease of toxin-antitoxin system
MRYLLDTHTVLWMREGSPRLNRPKWEPIFFSEEHEILVSIASLWEVTIKSSLGKLHLSGSIQNFADDLQYHHGFTLLPIEPAHLTRLAQLPLHHRDPFDRLLIAQAL